MAHPKRHGRIGVRFGGLSKCPKRADTKRVNPDTLGSRRHKVDSSATAPPKEAQTG